MKIAPVDRYANWRATGSESRAAAASRLQPVTSESTAPAVPAAMASGRELPVLATKKGDNVQSRPVRSSDTPRGAEPALNLFRQFQSLAPVAMTVEPPASTPDNPTPAALPPAPTLTMANLAPAPASATNVSQNTNVNTNVGVTVNTVVNPPANLVANAVTTPAVGNMQNTVAASAPNPAVDAPESANTPVGAPAPAQTMTPQGQTVSVQTPRPQAPQAASQDDNRMRPEDLLKQRDAVANAGRITSQRFSDITQAQAQSTETARQQAAEEAENTPPKEPLTQLLMDQVRSLWEASRGVIDAASPPDKPGAPARTEETVSGAALDARLAATTTTTTTAAPAFEASGAPASGANNAQASTS